MTKVLSLDDSSLTREFHSHIVKAAGFACVTAADGMEGLEKATAEKFQIVLTDINMQGLDGMEAEFLTTGGGLMRLARQSGELQPASASESAIERFDDYASAAPAAAGEVPLTPHAARSTQDPPATEKSPASAGLGDNVEMF